MMTNVLTSAINEKDVENTYRHNFLKKFKDMEITSPFGCDGFGVSKTFKVRTLMEFKDDVNLSNKSDLVKVLAQSVFYIKKFYDKGFGGRQFEEIQNNKRICLWYRNNVVIYQRGKENSVKDFILPEYYYEIAKHLTKIRHKTDKEPII